jgi:hypothetical protein
LHIRRERRGDRRQAGPVGAVQSTARLDNGREDDRAVLVQLHRIGVLLGSDGGLEFAQILVDLAIAHCICLEQSFVFGVVGLGQLDCMGLFRVGDGLAGEIGLDGGIIRSGERGQCGDVRGQRTVAAFSLAILARRLPLSGAILAVFVLFMGAFFTAALLVKRNRLGFGPNRCQRCGYDIRATPYHCPECGELWTLVRK